MTRSSCAWLLVLALATPVRAETVESAAEPAPEALAQAWFDQLFGGDSIELWETEWGGTSLRYGVARRWQAGRPEVFVRVLAPRAYDELSFLLRERPGDRFEVLYYRTPKLFPAGRKAARVMPVARPTPLERLPFAPGLPAIAELEPARATDYDFRRLPDATVAGMACRVLEGRPHVAELGFDRIVLSLARETGVALDTKWFAGEVLVRRVTTAPVDVRNESGRFLPTRRSVEQPDVEAQVFVSVRLMLDPVFPETLFTTQNLKAGRFPSY